ncbi:MAG: nucleoside deaminase [Neisseriaceae bacterium]|jgi:tRNA(Arg) A34 adenosine deaminase TadA
MFPHYLQKKLELLGIDNINGIKEIGYLKIYKWLCDIYQGISHNVLWDLYCLTYNLPLNSLNSAQKDLIYKKYKNILPTYQPLKDSVIEGFLNKAMEQAIVAREFNEVPVGAIIVKDDNIISSTFNHTKTNCDITAHAEIMAIHGAQKKLNNFRLEDCDLYVTIEPCLMCAGSIINSRIRRLIFGSVEPKSGAVVSQYQVFNNKMVNHHTEVIGPIDNEYYSTLLKNFFINKR